MQSFLGSLNYYGRFIENLAVYAAILYELREVDFAELRQQPTVERSDDDEPEKDDCSSKWSRAEAAFAALKNKVATTPILRHFDAEKEPVVIVFASEWAIAASLAQEHDGVYLPVMFISRRLKQNELNYGIAEKEVLAILRMLDLGYSMLVGKRIRVLTRHSTLAWLFRSAGLQGRLSQWAALLSPWTLEIERWVKGEDEILGALAACITPREKVDEALAAISPRKEPRKVISMPIPTVEPEEELWVASFDGSARVKRGGGAFSAIVWALPGWTVVAAASKYAADLRVNEAEYNGLLLCFELLQGLDPRRLVICGDSNLVIRQMRGEIDCKAPSLTLLRQRALERLRKWPTHDLLHVKRDWNASADSLASAALQREEGRVVEADGEMEDLITLNRLDEVLVPTMAGDTVRVSATRTRSQAGRSTKAKVLEEEVVQQLRVERIRRAQEEEAWIQQLKQYLQGNVQAMSQAEAKACSLLAADFEVDTQGLLYYCAPSARAEADRDGLLRLVVPESLQPDLLHHYHVSLEGGHQGISRTYQRIKPYFFWRGMFRSIQQVVGECVDCETGKGKPTIRGRSPGNIQATYPFQVIAMDHIPSLPKSVKGNTELLIWVDLFTGYVVAKASASRTAQTIAKSYEECVFRRFGASEVIRHDREPGFMSDFVRAFNRILGQRQRATMAYRPQANGTAERMVQTITRSIKMYVQDEDQRDWDEYAERLTFALNTAQDRIRGDTPFNLAHGWDPRTTLEATLPVGSTKRRDSNPRRWRYRIQKFYQLARRDVNERLKKAISERAEARNEQATPHRIEAGSRVVYTWIE